MLAHKILAHTVADLTTRLGAVDLDAGKISPRRRSSSFSFDRLTTPPTDSPPSAFPDSPPVRNRKVSSLMKPGSTFPHLDWVKKYESMMSIITSTSSDKKETWSSSGILIKAKTGQQAVLMCRHGLVEGATTVGVDFFDRSDLSDHKKHRYTGTMISDADIISSFGVFAGPDSDLVLIQIDKKDDQFPQTAAEISSLPDTPPETLIHLGYNGGLSYPTADLMVSEASSRCISMTEAIQRNLLVKGQRLTWSNGHTKGSVKSIEDQEDGTKIIVVQSETDKRTSEHRFEIKDATIKKYFVNGTVNDATLFVEASILIGTDHIIIGHKSGHGSSGGIYITPDGQLVAIHVGRLTTILGNASEQHFENHVALLPGIPFTSTFLMPYIELEGKVQKQKALLLDTIIAHIETFTTDVKSQLQINPIMADLKEWHWYQPSQYTATPNLPEILTSFEGGLTSLLNNLKDGNTFFNELLSQLNAIRESALQVKFDALSTEAILIKQGYAKKTNVNTSDYNQYPKNGLFVHPKYPKYELSIDVTYHLKDNEGKPEKCVKVYYHGTRYPLEGGKTTAIPDANNKINKVGTFCAITRAYTDHEKALKGKKLIPFPGDL